MEAKRCPSRVWVRAKVCECVCLGADARVSGVRVCVSAGSLSLRVGEPCAHVCECARAVTGHACPSGGVGCAGSFCGLLAAW